MHTRPQLLVGVLSVMLGALPARDARAQLDVVPVWGTRPAFEGLYTRLRFDSPGRATTAEGLGGRLMWGAAPQPGAAPSLLRRTSAGLFAAYTPERSHGFSTLQLGVVTDVHPLSLGGRVDPFLTLGAAALRTSVAPGRERETAALTPLADRTNTTLALTPGVGTRVRLGPGLALHGDVRDVLTFRRGTRHNLAFGTGLRFER